MFEHDFCQRFQSWTKVLILAKLWREGVCERTENKLQVFEVENLPFIS